MIAFFNKTKGSISLFLAIILLPMMTVAGLVVDSARISTAKTNLANASDLAMNAALSEYDKILYDVYGLFAISENMEDLQKNVSRYFSNTLNDAGILEDSDSYTREFINSIFSSFSSDELDFGNIVEVESGTFKITGVKDSTIANPKVLERQIVDYMKYRGPFNVGKGLLTKLGCIGETSKQSKALEKKIEFDKKLETIQDACQEAYAKIITYNDTVAGSKYKNGDYLGTIEKDLQSAKERMEKMVKYVLVAKDDSLQVSSYYKHDITFNDFKDIAIKGQGLSLFHLDSDVKNEVEKYFNKSKAENAALDTMDFITSRVSGSVSLKPGQNGEKYDYANTEFMQALYKLDPSAGGDLDREIAAIRNHKAVPGMDAIFTNLMMFVNYYEELSEEAEEEAEDDAAAAKAALEPYALRYEAYCEVLQVCLGSAELCEQYRASWKAGANKEGRAAAKLLYDWYKDAAAISAAAAAASSALSDVIKKADELKTVRTDWGNAVNNLSESDIKSSMKGDYDNSAQDINKEVIGKLSGVFDENKKHFDAIKTKLDAVKLNNVQVCFEEYDKADFTSRYASLSASKDDPGAAAAEIMSSKYVNQEMTGISPEHFEIIDGAESRENQQFYRYLQRTCATVEKKEDSEKKEKATNLKNYLMDKGNESVSAKLPTGIPSDLDEALPEDVRNAIDNLYKEENSPEAETDNTYEKGEVEKGKKDSEAADQGKENMSRMSKMLTSLTQIAAAAGEQMRDNLYVEEYYTEMFSCFTDAVEKDGVKPNPKTLSNKEMNTNPLFGAEAEYILWGTTDVQKNLDCMKASIFGIRFLLNSIYAFTNADTRTPALTSATAIAGWTGFGVPIVQTVILIAWAMAESILDVNTLCAGEAVALYKTNSTWVLSLSGAEKALEAKAKGEIEKFATKTINNVFDSIENYVVDQTGEAADKLTNAVRNFANDTLYGIYESVQGAIAVPVEQLALQIAGSVETLDLSSIEDRVEETLAGLAGNNGDGLVNECVRIAAEQLAKNEKAQIARRLYDMYLAARDPAQTVDYINEQLYGKDGQGGLIGDLVGKVRSAIEGRIEKYGNEFKDSVEKEIRAGGDKMKETVKEKINSFTGGISGKASGEANNGVVGAASGFSFSYKEYVKVFILIHAMTGEGSRDAMLKRAAGLIQENTKAAGHETKVTEAYTVVQASSSADVRTTFFSVPVSTTDQNGSTTYDLDYSAIGSGKQTVKYIGVLGY